MEQEQESSTATAEGQQESQGQETQQQETQTEQGQETQQQEDGGQSAGGAEGQPTGRANDRIRQLVAKNREYEQRMASMESELQRFRTPDDQRVAADRKKEIAKKFYGDPAGYVEGLREEMRQEMRNHLSEQQDLAQYQVAIGQLRAAPGWSKELEAAMAERLTKYGFTDRDLLQKVGRVKVLQMAYEATTGKPWGEWSQDGYNTRRMKERLMRPGAGGGPGAGSGRSVSPDDYNKAMTDLSRRQLSEEEFSREMRRLGDGLDSWYAANPQQ